MKTDAEVDECLDKLNIELLAAISGRAECVDRVIKLSRAMNICIKGLLFRMKR